MSSCRHVVRYPAILLALVVTAIASPQPAAAQVSCFYNADKGPAEPPPSNLWSALEPAYTELPHCQSPSPSCKSRDTSPYNQALVPWFGTPYWESIAVKGGYAFLSTQLGFQIWDVEGGSNPEMPERMSYVDGRVFIPINTAEPHQYFQFRDMDASDDGNLLAFTGGYSTGMAIIDVTTSKATPKLLYQDPASETTGIAGGYAVHVQRIGGRDYSFLASGGANANTANRGVFAYDMTRAKEHSIPGGCIDLQPTNPNPSCAGVYKGRYSTKRSSHIDGAGDDNNGHFVVASGGLFDGLENAGFTIWRVTNPAAPVQVLTGHSGVRIDGVALWQEGSKFFLALANRGASGVGPSKGQIYDVSCIKTGSCGSLPSMLVYEFPLAGYTAGFNNHDAVVQDSADGARNWIFYGFREAQGAQGLQMEWLFDVTGLSSTNPPSEITGGDPQNGNQGQPTMSVGNPAVTVGYWSYMYFCHPSGANYYQGRGGVVSNGRFYRAGHSIFDIHRAGSVTPQITVSGPSTGYAGQSIQFSATATGCSPTAGGWSWAASNGGQVVSGGTSASATIQWGATGNNRSVTASNSGCSGATQVAATIDILDPAPSIGSVTASPTMAPVCTPIEFQATATGQPPLSFNWSIEQGGNPVPGEGGSGNPFVWDTEGVAPGTYRGRATVSGPGGSDNEVSPQVTLTALDPLPNPGFAIGVQTQSFGTVTFSSAGADPEDFGVTEWRWDFGDGTILQTTDRSEGESPMHSYAEVGLYDVTLQVRNCVDTAFVTSQVLVVDIDEVDPLEIGQFKANCAFIVCAVTVGQPQTFTTIVSGTPDFYDYDWDGDGDYDQTSSTPVSSHTYTQEGLFRPRLRIRRGALSEVADCQNQVQVTSGGPPPPPASITVSGPATRDIGEEGTYTASASNCTPSSNGWTWTTSGGTGSSTGSSITVSWTSTGPKTVTAKNSACGTAIGARIVNVTEGGGGNPNPGDLGAEFTVFPANPDPGEEVTFDASASAGGPTAWVWDFGDGSGGSGEVVTHTFDEAGTYNVELTISKTAPGCGQFGQNLCVDSATASVVVGGGGGGGDCVVDANTLCLMDGRFQVRARFVHPQNGIQPAKVYEPFSADRTGMFWFFRPDNVELITKSLDATNPDVFPNPAYWFFYGGLSNVEYWIEVTDTADPSVEPVEYHNLPGVICGQADTGAFPTEDIPVPAQGGAVAGAPITGAALFEVEDRPGVIAAGGSSGTCVPSLQRLCLLDGRFAVEVDWHDQHNNEDGVGQAITGTDRTGYFWFFRDDNIELVTKMVDGRPGGFNHFWIFWGGLSDVEYTIKVTDTVTEQSQEYSNPPGSFCGGADTTAFPAD